MESGDRPIKGDGKDQPKKAPEPKPNEANKEAADLLNKRAKPAEKPNTADKHLPKVEITDASAKRQAQQDKMREKSGRESKDQAVQERQRERRPPEK